MHTIANERQLINQMLQGDPFHPWGVAQQNRSFVWPIYTRTILLNVVVGRAAFENHYLIDFHRWWSASKLDFNFLFEIYCHSISRRWILNWRFDVHYHCIHLEFNSKIRTSDKAKSTKSNAVSINGCLFGILSMQLVVWTEPLKQHESIGYYGGT